MVGNILTFSSHILNPHLSEDVFPSNADNWERFHVVSRLFSARNLSRAWNQCPNVSLREQKSKPKGREDIRARFSIHALAPPSATPVIGRLKARKPEIDVLIVEASIFEQQAISKILDSLNYWPTFAETGERALSLCKSNKYDIIFMDINLPGSMNGIMTTQMIRKTKTLNRKTFITALTSYDDPFIKEESFKAGMNYYQLKPLTSFKAKKISRLAKK